jgi:hypothetical protein
VRAASVTALQHGGVIIPPSLYPESTGTRVEWDIAPRCERPIEIVEEGEGHYQPSRSRMELEWQPNRTLAKLVPCRQCASCLRSRALEWSNRSKREFQWTENRGLRTWFGTLTFAPVERFRILSSTRRRLDAVGVDLASLNPVDRYREQHRETGPLVSKFIRSLRKGRKKLGQKPMFFRYLLTVEPHKDWTPHYHLMVHEIVDLHPVRKQDLEDRWAKLGFSHWRLVKDPMAAAYAAKYLGKFSTARVRASKRYGDVGNTSSDIENPRF